MTLFFQTIVSILFLIIIIGTILSIGISLKKKEEDSPHTIEKQIPMGIRIIDQISISATTTTTNPVYFNQPEENK